MAAVCLILGAVVGYFIVTLNDAGITSAPVVLYHLFWVTLSVLITKLFG